jgi:hypothetical protein
MIVATRVELRWCKSTACISPMHSNVHLAAKVLGPRQNQEKTESKRLEGVPQQLSLGNRKKTKTKNSRPEKMSSEVIQRLITHLVKPQAYPPAFDSLPTRTCRRRWVSKKDVAIVSESFRLTEGHRQFLVVTVANTTAVCYVDCWRIKSISIWCNNDVEDATTVTIFPVTGDIDSNTFNDRESGFTCSSRSEAKPGCMKIIPARDTPLGGWHKTSTVNATGSLFTINVNNGGASSGDWGTTTMDIEFEYVENLLGSPQGYSVTISAVASVGSLGGSDLFFPGGGASAMVLQNINRLI